MNEYRCIVCKEIIETSNSSNAIKLVMGYFYKKNSPFSFEEISTEGYTHINCLKERLALNQSLASKEEK